MRLVSVALIASLTLAPGCLYLAAPPAVGATIGGISAAAADRPGHRTSVGNRAIVGGLIGLAIDTIAIIWLVSALSDFRFESQ